MNEINIIISYKKIYRKKINKIELDFVYNFSGNKITFDNIKIDNETNDNLDKYIENLKSELRISNKIIIKNFINNFFKAYSG